MKKTLSVMCAVLLTAGIANALPERGFVGGQNETKDPVFFHEVATRDGMDTFEDGTPVIDSWDIQSTVFWDGFLQMWTVEGFAYDHGQSSQEYSILTTFVNAEDGNLYNPLASTQMINLSFYAHIDDGGYVRAGIYWWDSINPELFELGEGFDLEGLPDPDHEILLYHEDNDFDNYYENSDFDIYSSMPGDGEDGEGGEEGEGDGEGDGEDGEQDPVVEDEWGHIYDLFIYETEIDTNPQYLMIQIEIGHNWYEMPSSAFIHDIQAQQQSGIPEIAIPEPATLVLLGIGALAGFIRRFKK
ncbi:MAG: PEP-CTERM sorting domain-containing protein [Candidatus Auribacter fodinae]|jgi:hypothetical protein|uniref:PEP-CTERM sorting domain-containing protein n=1 Tax=Candidatus Auribacter fodinae TaxID=2093366 RepID=A0A3A4QXH7_9BACT|nr:MAG: PEP-CTERM sorting domain-containing protein [Candidatus Auribacter fodinae]